MRVRFKFNFAVRATQPEIRLWRYPAALRMSPVGGFGTDTGGHKGFALGLMVETLTGILVQK